MDRYKHMSKTASPKPAQTHNSWITLSKLIIENNREAIAAPEINASVTILNSEAVFFTVAGERSVGTGPVLEENFGRSMRKRRKGTCWRGFWRRVAMWPAA
ncbi:hypothetical protein NMY22_g16816 [Coprinellus aureogranulatus]|nr:hypothetical protein NMY22_g16816 [Coprinellus aureogranulatus]